MIDKKYGKLLNIGLIVGAIIIIGLLVFWGIQIYQNYFVNKEAEEVVDEFLADDTSQNKTNNEVEDVALNVSNLEIATSDTTNSKIAKKTYKGFTMDGIIEIPKINLRYPVLDRATEKSMEVAVGINYGPGLNKVGNTVIMGHNSSNGTFFSNLEKLKENDPIYITDNDKAKVKYVVYNMYTTTPEDLDYYTRDTEGKREISLSTCMTNDTSHRLVIWAREAENQN